MDEESIVKEERKVEAIGNKIEAAGDKEEVEGRIGVEEERKIREAEA